MEIFNIKNLGFQYAHSEKKVLHDISFQVNQGDFILIAGESGCGKTTLLSQLKPGLTPYGRQSGTITYLGQPLHKLDEASSACEIGYVMQHPAHQIVCDKVWHELAFGLENMGLSQSTMHHRVGEMAAFFNLEDIYHQDTSSLSGGQMQIVNLASIMAMHPNVLLLDEPCAQLDPIAKTQFLQTLKQVNDEFATTIILVEHHLEEAIKLADRVLIMDKGTRLCEETPRDLINTLQSIASNHAIITALPMAMRLYDRYAFKHCPLSVKEAKQTIHEYFTKAKKQCEDEQVQSKLLLQVKDAYFRYEKQGRDILKGLSIDVYAHEILAIVGGNGAGKTTSLKLLAGLEHAYQGGIHWKNNVSIGYLPQDVQSLFVKDSIGEDLKHYTKQLETKIPDLQKKSEDLYQTLHIKHLFHQHPYDVSGGELQKVALCKVLLKEPDILLLDEPTKGLDSFQSEQIVEVLKQLQRMKKTIILISHDIEFCAQVADRCAMLFDGRMIAIKKSENFFLENRFYTTTAAKIAHDFFERVYTWKELCAICDTQI